MAQLVVRNLENDIKARLQARARRHRRSLEAEIRDILRRAAMTEEKPEGGLGSEIAARFRGLGLKEDIPELRGFTIEPPIFEE